MDRVKKCGIRQSPPAFVIVYESSGSLRRKVIPLRHFTSSSNVEFVALELKERQDLEKVPIVKIRKMLRLLQHLQNGVPMTEAVDTIRKQFELKLNEDLNKLPTEELELQKELMESIFVRNQIKQDDENFVYDKRVDFAGEKTESAWDLEPDDNFWD